MGGKSTFFATLAAVLLAALMPQPAMARVALFAKSCALPSNTALSLEAAEARQDWSCAPDTKSAETPYLWLRIDGADLPQGANQRLVSDAMPFAGMTAVVRFADASQRAARFSARDIVSHSAPATRFSIPIYSADESPTALFVRIDKPFDTPVATMLSLESQAFSSANELRDLILFGIFIGMLLAIAIYSISLSLTLKTSFGWFHAGMVLLFLLYTLASSSLIFLILPDLSLWGRTSISYVSLSFSMALMAPFIARFIENWAVPPWLWHVTHLSGVGLAVIGIAVPLLGPNLPFLMRTIYHLGFVPVIASFLFAGIFALARQSKAVRLVFLAWLMPMVFALERIARSLFDYSLPFAMDLGLFFAMAYQALVMAFAIAWRIGEIRRERDEAWAVERQLSQLAQTDALTGLPNRRAFDQRKWRRGDYLAAVDIDRFKRINDSCGHAIGDEVLRIVGNALAGLIDRKQIIGAWRVGGEEFAVLVEANTVTEASHILNRLRGQLSAAIAEGLPRLNDRVTVSAGVAEIGRLGIVPAYEAADRALYHAKNSGRDRLSYEATKREIATIFPRRAASKRAA